MTRIKICGITNIDDAVAAAEAGADALGIVFAPSPRQISAEIAREIVRALPKSVITVGVFQNADLDEVRDTADRVGFDCVQLHGDESPEYCNGLGRCVIKRFSTTNDDAPADLLVRMSGYRAFAYVLDPGAGSGKTFRWEQAKGLGVRLIIAGGLSPSNVSEPVRLLRPFAVDVATGVESAPGRKDHAKMRAFVQAVRQTDADIAG